MKPLPRFWLSLAICVACLGSWVRVRAEAVQVPTGTWATAGSLSEGRSGATAVQLLDGRVLVTGGQGTESVLASAEIFDAAGPFTSAAAILQGDPFVRVAAIDENSAAEVSAVLASLRALQRDHQRVGVFLALQAACLGEIFDGTGRYLGGTPCS